MATKLNWLAGKRVLVLAVAVVASIALGKVGVHHPFDGYGFYDGPR